MKTWMFLFLMLLLSIASYGQDKTELKEVVVRPNLKKVELGTKQKRADYGHGGSKDHPHYQTAFLIPSDGKAGFIDKVGVYIYQKHTFLEFFRRSNTLYLYLYKVSPEGMPGDLLLPGPIAIEPKKNTYWHWVDISSRNIALPEQGVFAAVGWQRVSKTDTGPYVGMTNECDTCPFYVYRFPNNEPVWLKVEQSAMQASGKKKKKERMYQNLMVKLEVSVK
ncbi:MAG: hypothetical protein LPK14_09030 [Hymenobacteraceae bacterium]|mgnify:FL=1|nr:hypothetical protein [Hymenobacteraceae bacterium]